MGKYLSLIKITLPNNTFSNNKDFLNLFENCKTSASQINFPVEPVKSHPEIIVEFSGLSNIPFVTFFNAQTKILEIPISNNSGEQWKSKYNYTHIELKDFISRLKANNLKFESYDHLGFNLPSRNNLNPQIEILITQLKSISLMHKFLHEDWFFILPGNSEEIDGKKEINYQEERKPKFEIVNFKNASTPLVQIDVAVNSKYLKFKEIFPEAIHDDKLNNVWIYLENTSGIDICIVLNEMTHGWTSYFEGKRV